MIRRFVSAALLLTLLASPAIAVTPEDWTEDLGAEPHGHLSMLFEVSFFRIDIATVEAFLAPEHAARIGALLEAEDWNDDTRDRIAEILRGAKPAAVKMTFLRDSGWERLPEGYRKNFERAIEEGELTEEEFDSMQPEFLADFAALEERGMVKGDAVLHRFDGNGVRSGYFDAEGNPLVDVQHEGEIRARALHAIFLGSPSRYVEKLIESLERD